LVPSLPPDESRDLPTLFAMMGFVSYGAPTGRVARWLRVLGWPLAWVFDALFSGWAAWMLRRALLRRSRSHQPDE
jgi:membrane protein implicated in regulation of membrane protease activity